MNKKKKGQEHKEGVSYAQKSLKYIADYLNFRRRNIQGSGQAELIIDLKDLEKAIKKLPEDLRKKVEYFWGLIPGSRNHGKEIFDLKKVKSNEYQERRRQADKAIMKLQTIGYLSMYDCNVASLVERLMKKIKIDNLSIVPIDAIKYLLILLIFFFGGPKLFFEKELELDSENNEQRYFDHYTVLRTVENAFAQLKDSSINLALFLKILEMLDLKTISEMKKSVGLEDEESVGLEEEDSVSAIVTLQEIRGLKEDVFREGEWSATIKAILGESEYVERHKKLFVNYMIEGDGTNKETYEQFKDWCNGFKNGTKEVLFSTGLRSLDIYRIEGISFSDKYEIIALFFAYH